MRCLSFHGIPLWRDVRVLRAAVQIVSAVLAVTIVVFFIDNLFSAADKRGLAMGFGFLREEAGFLIGESVLAYEESDSFQYAFLAGVVNTLKAALLGIVLATVLGIVVGGARLSNNWLVGKIAGVYVEFFRNIPCWCNCSSGILASFCCCPKCAIVFNGLGRSI